MNDFLEAAIRFVRKRAAEIAGTRDYEFVDFAAHLFAIASELWLTNGSARLTFLLDRREVPPVTELPSMLGQLSRLPDGLDASELYLYLIDALVTVEGELSRYPATDVGALRGWTDLDGGLSMGPGRRLSGRVYYWLRPEEVALARKRDRRYDSAENPPPDPVPHPGTYLRRLTLYWDSDPQLPWVTPPSRTDRNVHLVDESGRDAAERRSFRIALCPLEGASHPLFAIDPGGKYFRIGSPGRKGVKDFNAVRDHLEQLAEAAREDGIHLLMLPELTVDRPARKRLARLLSRRPAETPPYGILAGSFHIWNRRNSPPINETRLLDQAGRRLLSHSKRGRFRIPPAAVEAYPHLFTGTIPKDLAKGIVEDIEWGTRLEVLETSLGRFAVLICADGIVRDPEHSLVPVIQRVRPDLLLITSMSAETGPFEELMEILSTYWIASFFVNAHCICSSPVKGKPLLAACNLALYEPEGKPATRFRWRMGQSEPECIYFKPPDGNKRWRPLPDGETGASLWKKGDRTLGMVVDLGVHWKTEDLEEDGQQTASEEKISS